MVRPLAAKWGTPFLGRSLLSVGEHDRTARPAVRLNGTRLGPAAVRIVGVVPLARRRRGLGEPFAPLTTQPLR